MTRHSMHPQAPASPERRQLAAHIAWALGGLALTGCGGGGDAAAAATAAGTATGVPPAPTPSPAPTPAPPPPAPLPPPPPPAPTVSSTITTLSVQSTGAGTFPYSATVLPLRGQLPAGDRLESPDDATLAMSILSTHDDGSAAVVVVAGTVSVSANAASALRLQRASTPVAGADLTAAAITALVNRVSVDFGNYGVATLTDFSRPERVWWASARTICARYRMAASMPGSTALEAVIDIQAWGDRARVELVVENCKMMTASPTAPSAANYSAAVVTVNGSTVATVNGNGAPESAHSKFRSWYASAWVGAGNPGLRVTQSHTDLQKHPLLFKCDQASSFDMANYASDAYTPWGTGRQRPGSMGAGGDHDSIGPLPSWDARALQTGDDRGWNASEANALVCLGYGINYRDTTSGQVPNFLELAGKTMQSNWPSQAYGGAMGWEAAHHPAAGLMAFIARPSPVFIELAQKVAVTNGTWSTFQGAQTGVFGGPYGTRGKGWCMRSLAHATFLTPDAQSAWKAAARTSIAQNVTYMDVYRTDARSKLNMAWDDTLNNITGYGVGPPTGSATNAKGMAIWQHNYLTTEYHKTASARLLAGSDQFAIEAFADWCALMQVRWINEQPNGAWRYIPYAAPISRQENVMDQLPDWGQQMDWWHDDSPPSVSGAWFSTGGFPHTYAGYSVESSAGAYYPGYFWSALVAAVERNVPGAATAWETLQRNLTGLDNWRRGFGFDPRWGAAPRNR